MAGSIFQGRVLYNIDAWGRHVSSAAPDPLTEALRPFSGPRDVLLLQRPLSPMCPSPLSPSPYYILPTFHSDTFQENAIHHEEAESRPQGPKSR